jgi:outer membrane protein
MIEYQEGESSTMTLVDSETKLREAQTNYINSLLELYIARLDIEKANGTLTTYLTKPEKQ